jgi:uncharacterized protein YbaR (Trm112 family)
MKRDLVDILACPVSKVPLELVEETSKGDEIESGALICPTCQHTYYIVEGVPHLLPWDICSNLTASDD